tara:strand:+ start:443 stop:649 length:207 start_codon:yes stop_codon:yes gene_type:complete
MNSKSSNMGWGYELIAAICIFALGIAFAYSSFRQGDHLAAGVMAIGSLVPLLLSLGLLNINWPKASDN